MLIMNVKLEEITNELGSCDMSCLKALVSQTSAPQDDMSCCEQPPLTACPIVFECNTKNETSANSPLLKCVCKNHCLVDGESLNCDSFKMFAVFSQI